MTERKDLLESAHPYEVACELATPFNSLRALLMAAMLKADGPNLRRLIDAFPQVHADLVHYKAMYRNGG